MRRQVVLVPILALLGVVLVPSAALAGSNAQTKTLSTDLSGSEVPGGTGDPNATGTATIRFRPGHGLVCYELSWAKVNGKVDRAHIHIAPVGQAGPHHIELFNDANYPGKDSVSQCVAADREAIQAVLDDPDQFYVNVHSTKFHVGALRGQLARS